ncbi:MAG TPA: DMT family transporter [Devosia sp.]|nr:DMT family transporter [Devosia sp.]
MNQAASTSLKNSAITASIFMVCAQAIFAVVNFTYDVLTNPWNPLLEGEKLTSSSAVFWQYLIAALFALPLVFRIGLDKLKTRHPLLHELRALASALGAQVFVFGFASGVPVWQMVGLLLTGPFFVLAGSALFLGERMSPTRISMSVIAFCGAFLIVGFGSDSFTAASLLPVLAAALWSTTTLISKYLSHEETAETLTLSLVLLISLNHAIIGIVLGILVVFLPPESLPATLSGGFDFSFPAGNAAWWIIFLGFVTAVSQYLLWSAYKRADAAYLQPFDDLKLPLNVLVGWVVLSQVPSLWFWPGAALVICASLYIAFAENRSRKTPRIVV